jgi:flagellar hook-associated protein 3 FlgL
MNYRISDTGSSSNTAARINTQRSLIATLQERLATGKRINRPSDNPGGAQAVFNLRTTQAEIEQFKPSAQAVYQKLVAADDTLNSYETVLERVRTLVSQGLSDTSTPQARAALATEIESIRGRVLSMANAQNGGEYIFGGTRQNASPYDPVTAVGSLISTVEQFVQIEPGANAIATGVIAERIFEDEKSDIFTDLTLAVNALRGTGDAAADKLTLQDSMVRLGVYRDQVVLSQAKIGANMNTAEMAVENLTMSSLSLDERALEIEGDDFAETAVSLSETQNTLDAILQVAARGRTSLFDYLG